MGYEGLVGSLSTVFFCSYRFEVVDTSMTYLLRTQSTSATGDGKLKW